MAPTDPNEPLPTTPVEPAAPPPAEPPRASAPPAAGWGAPPAWGAPPPHVPPPPPPRRDRLALGVVAFIFGGLFLVFFGFLVLAYGAVKGESPTLSTGPKIAVIEVKGAIGVDGGVDADRVLRQIRRVSEDGGMKAVLVRIDSPGGAVGPSQEIHDEVRRLAEKKVVICSMGSMAASGGFYVAMGCDKIVAEAGTLTGSIGVILQFPNLKGLVERWDIKFETVKSGKLKDTTNPFSDMTPEKRAYLQDLSDQIYRQFLAAVAEGRELPEAEVRQVADGRILTGAEAKERGLVDEIGNFYDAVDLAKTEANLSGEPHLVYPPDGRARFLDQLFGSLVHATADAIRAEVRREAAAEGQLGLYYLAR
jgi:protease-4